MNYSLSLQTMVVLLPIILDSDALIWYVHVANVSTTKVPYLSRHVRAHTYIKQRGENFGTHFFLCLWGLETNRTQTFFCLQNLKNLFYHSKILQDGLYGHNVYICTL